MHLTAIARLMHTSVHAESLIESTRLVLADRPDFCPEQAYLRFDRDRKGGITAQDIVSFMKQNRQEYSLEQAESFIRPYDDDCDEALSYTEFLYCVLSSSMVYRDKVIKRLKEKDLRVRRGKDRITIQMGLNPKTLHPLARLSYEVEYGLRRLIE